MRLKNIPRNFWIVVLVVSSFLAGLAATSYFGREQGERWSDVRKLVLAKKLSGPNERLTYLRLMAEKNQRQIETMIVNQVAGDVAVANALLKEHIKHDTEEAVCNYLAGVLEVRKKIKDIGDTDSRRFLDKQVSMVLATGRCKKEIVQMEQGAK
jgi:hypothetical protein